MKKFTSILLSLIFLFNFIFPSVIFAATPTVKLELGTENQNSQTAKWAWVFNVKTTNIPDGGEVTVGLFKNGVKDGNLTTVKITKNNGSYYTSSVLDSLTTYQVVAAYSGVKYDQFEKQTPEGVSRDITGTPADRGTVIGSDTPAVEIKPAATGTVGNEISKVYTLLAPIGNFKTFSSNNIGEYLNTMFRLAIGLCAALAVVMIIFSGVQYMGSESIFGKTEAKSKVFSAVLGLLIALGSWVLLNTINPDLTGKNGLNIDTATSILPLYDRGSSDAKKANGESVRCTPVLSGPCSVANLTNVFGAANAVAMSKICNMESNGTNASSSTDICKPNNETFSFGLFQVNLAANGGLAGSDCVGLFDKKVSAKDVIEPRYTSGYSCKLISGKQSIYNTCKNRLLDPTKNLAIAKSLFTASKSAWIGDKKYCASAFN